MFSLFYQLHFDDQICKGQEEGALVSWNPRTHQAQGGSSMVGDPTWKTQGGEELPKLGLQSQFGGKAETFQKVLD